MTRPTPPTPSTDRPPGAPTPSPPSPPSAAATTVPAGSAEPLLPAQARPPARVAGELPGDIPEEWPAPCLPGWAAGATATLGAAAALWLLWQGGTLPGWATGGPPLHLPRLPSPPRYSTGGGLWAAVAAVGTVVLGALTGLVRGRPGSVLVLTRHRDYRGTVRRTGLLWVSPLLRRRRVDVSLRHWRSSPIEAVDADGTPIQVRVLLVWRVRDTARAVFAVDDHVEYLRELVEAAVARAVSRHPVDDFRGGSPTLRDCERLGDHLGRLVATGLRPVGVEVFSATPVRLEYAADVAATMRRSRVAALDAKRRKAVLDDVLAAVAETVRGISERGIVELDDYERKALVRDLTVALCAEPVQR